MTEAYVDFTPSLDYSAMTQRLLSTVPDKYLVGLDSVVLCNFSGQSRKQRIGSIAQNGRRIRRTRIAGLYRRRRGENAWIQIFVDKVGTPPRYIRWFQPLRDILFGQVLYHELGHHAHRIRPEYRESEHVADSWAARFTANHIKRRYWYLYPVLRLVAIIATRLRRKTRTRRA